MAKKIFITGIGTDIGKTYVSGLLVKKMRGFSLNCGYFKPILSGALRKGDKLIPGDCKHVIDIANLDTEPLKCLSYCFEEAVSPHLAAKRAGVEINKTKILSDFNNVSKMYDYILIEGAGGITCPIILNDGETYLMNDLIKDMKTNILIVADGGLGTLNSILTTVEYALKRNITIKGIILNNYDETNFMHIDNLKMAEKLTGINVIATVSKNSQNIEITKDIIEGLFEE